MNSVRPKAGAKHELLFSKPVSNWYHGAQGAKASPAIVAVAGFLKLQHFANANEPLRVCCNHSHSIS